MRDFDELMAEQSPEVQAAVYRRSQELRAEILQSQQDGAQGGDAGRVEFADAFNARMDAQRRRVNAIAPQATPAAVDDAARFAWLAPRLIAADFHYDGGGESREVVLVFAFPENVPISADVRRTIDAALAASTREDANG